jgi:hypothetical protein
VKRNLAIAVLILAALGGLRTAGVGSQASSFIHYYQKSKRFPAHLSTWERVVFSLIRAVGPTSS